jgi:hypothetical protein
MILLCTKNLYPVHGSHSPFDRKMCILLLMRCHCPPIWPHAPTLNLTYIWIVPSKLSLAHPSQSPYVPHSISDVHIPSLRSFIQIIHPSPRLSKLFHNTLIYDEEFPRPTPKLDDHPVICVWMPIQCIHTSILWLNSLNTCNSPN